MMKIMIGKIMRYLKTYEIVNSLNKLDEVFSEVNDYVNDLKKCEPGSLLYRGIPNAGKPYDIKMFEPVFDRYPINTPKDIHDDLNNLFYKKFGWYCRDGVFCFGNIYDNNTLKFDCDYAATSENAYLVFPADDYKIIWSPDVYDLFSELEYDENEDDEFSRDHSVLSDLVEKYKSGDLCKALHYENEIMVDCEYYYLVNQKYKYEVIERIWGLTKEEFDNL